MAGLIKRRGGNVIFQSQTLTALYSKLQRSNCTLSEGFMKKCSKIRQAPDGDRNSVDTSKWKKIRASDVGIRNSMIPEYSMNVLRLLRRQGFDAYLVGGCVRDLILHRAPKDYDVITTANLKQIRRLFHRAQLIGKRFPICQVWMGGSIIEVSSFDTVAQSDDKHGNDLGKSKEKDNVPQTTEGNKISSLFKLYSTSEWDIKDRNRWKNSLVRDFTINSLFYDPFEFKIYDYSNGMEDLKDLKLRTIVPAQVSFKEDCARILRGLRIAARLGLSISKDIQTAIPEFVSSVANLNQFRFILEMNYMLAYGAAAPSILLLMKFKLLHVLLPCQAAYLDRASEKSLLNSSMLVRLFSNMDKLVSCDQPADSRLWVALLAFHNAVVQYPQEPIVLCAFASLLYHRNWNKAVQFAREHENSISRYAPEVSKSSKKISDEDLAEAVSEFVDIIKETQNALIEMKALREALDLYPDFKCSGLVFIPKKTGRDLSNWFGKLSDVKSYTSGKHGFSIDYNSLGKGNPCELGFVLGKIIQDTLTEGTDIEKLNSVQKKQSQNVPVVISEKMGELVIYKPANGLAAPVQGLKSSSVSKTQKKILKMMTVDNEDKSDQVTEVDRDSSFYGPATNHEQSLIRKSKKRSTKEAPEASKAPRISKRSRSDEQEWFGSLSDPAKNQDQSTVQKSNNHSTKKPVSEMPKPKSSKRSKSDEQEWCGSLTDPAKDQDQSIVEKSNSHDKKTPVSATSKPKSLKRLSSDERECIESLSAQPKNQDQDQSVVKKSNSHDKKKPATETPKPKSVKRPRSEEQGCAESLSDPAKNLDQFIDQKTNKHGTKKQVSETAGRVSGPDSTLSGSAKNKRGTEAPVSKAANPKRSRSDKQEYVESLDVPDSTDKQAPVYEPLYQKPSKETHKTKHNGFGSDESMNNLIKVLEKSRQQVPSKEEAVSLSSDKRKRPRTLSSLFK